MRLLILGVSALSLTACSMGGVGFGTGHSDYRMPASHGYGNWDASQTSYYDQSQHAGHETVGHDARYGMTSGHTAQPQYGAAPVQGRYKGQHHGQYQQHQNAPATSPCQQAYQAPCAAHEYAAPQFPQPHLGHTSVPAPTPCPQVYQAPCATQKPQTPDYAAQYMEGQNIGYPNGYPFAPAPRPAPSAPIQFNSSSCGVSACGSSYSVSPYADNGGYEPHEVHAYQTANPYSYGMPRKPVHSQMSPQEAHFYGTVGAVLYDTENKAAGLQARLGYQSPFYLGGEIEGSIGVIDESGTTDIPDGAGGTVTVDTATGVKNSYAGFGLLRVPVGKAMSIFGRGGYHETQTYVDTDLAVGGPSTRAESKMSGLAYGAGIEFDISTKSAVRADFTRYEGDTQDNDAVSLSYLRRF